MRFNTALLHGDFRGDAATGATLTPVYQSSAFEHKTAEELENVIVKYNPDASADTLLEMGANYSTEDTMQRHGA